MELSFNQLKKLQVVCVADGKNLGHVCDMSFTYPENKLRGFFVTGGKGFKFVREEQFIAMQRIVRVGEDVILVNAENKPAPCSPHGRPPKPCPPPNGCAPQDGCE